MPTTNSTVVSNPKIATATFERSAWDTDNHNYWISETIRIAKVTASTNPNQLTNAVEQSQQATVHLQSKPIVTIDQLELEETIIVPSVIENSIIPWSETKCNNCNLQQVDCKVNKSVFSTLMNNNELQNNKFSTTCTHNNQADGGQADGNTTNTTPTAKFAILNSCDKNFDPRLFTESNKTLTKIQFLSIITDYTGAKDRISAFIMRNCHFPKYKVVHNKNLASNFSITGNDLTPAHTSANSLATTYASTHKINAVRIQTSTKRKSASIKFSLRRIIRKEGKEHPLSTINTNRVVIDAQADTGANISATNKIDIIHNYVKYTKPIEVGVFSESDETATTLQAVGEGTMKIISDQGSIMNWLVLFTPNSTGTVLSPDNYHQNNLSKYFAFYHMGTSNNDGKIGFLDHNEREIESVQLQRTENGEWMTPNQILIASPTNKHIVRQVTRFSERIRNQQIEKNSAAQAKEEQRITAEEELKQQQKLKWQQQRNNDEQKEEMEIQQQRSESWHQPLNKDVFDKMSQDAHPTFNNAPGEKRSLSQQIKDLELWHQRLGHCSTRTMNETRKCTNGIPNLPTTSPFFKCPFCESAKMLKKGGKRTNRDNFIPAQAYHMDLSFVSGPSNLNDISKCQTTPKITIKQSRDGYIGFLTIIDVATRSLWTHLVKNKDPPIAYIDRFLRRHGIRNTDPSKAIITTSKTGYLAKSKEFKATANKLKYSIQKTTDDPDFFSDLLPDHVDPTITTDGGGELSKSFDFRRKANEHGYEVEATAADSSSSNGIVERPHRTLKERMRCMLYSA